VDEPRPVRVVPGKIRAAAGKTGPGRWMTDPAWYVYASVRTTRGRWRRGEQIWLDWTD
jgi:hypothetical protein